MINFLLPLRQKRQPNEILHYMGKDRSKVFYYEIKKEDILEIKTPVQIKNMTMKVP